MNLYIYIALGVVALAYLLYLFVPKAKGFYLIGVSQKVQKILHENVDLKKTHTIKMQNAIKALETLFESANGVDYYRLLDILKKIKISMPDLTAVIDLLTEKTLDDHPYCLLAQEKSLVFEMAHQKIETSNQVDALGALNQVYQQCVATEDSYRKKARRDFWIGTAIGIAGLIVGIIPLF